MNRYLTRSSVTLISTLLASSVAACTSTKEAQSIEDLEQAKDPLAEADCLEGEVFDKETESCEPISQGSDIEAPPGDIDLPLDESPDLGDDPYGTPEDTESGY